mmetsp:Transcript_5067/g.16040  ORF Transcript_5067/g.16040 Transcript_5067/m.16040 type:complete len:239 (+) Transcript_5067:473-1189(+)
MRVGHPAPARGREPPFGRLLRHRDEARARGRRQGRRRVHDGEGARVRARPAAAPQHRRGRERHRRCLRDVSRGAVRHGPRGGGGRRPACVGRRAARRADRGLARRAEPGPHGLRDAARRVRGGVRGRPRGAVRGEPRQRAGAVEGCPRRPPGDPPLARAGDRAPRPRPLRVPGLLLWLRRDGSAPADARGVGGRGGPCLGPRHAAAPLRGYRRGQHAAADAARPPRRWHRGGGRELHE